AGRLYFTGDLTISGGTLQRSSTANNTGSGIYFNGALNATQTFTWSGGTIYGSAQNFFYYNNANNLHINEVYSSSTSSQTMINGNLNTPVSASYSAWPTSGGVINDVTISNSNGVLMSSSRTINGTLSLQNGTLHVGAYTLTCPTSSIT